MIRVKENKKSLNGLKGYYAYSHVDEYGNPIDLNVVTDTSLDDEGFVCSVTYCQLPDVDRDGEFNAFNTYHDTIMSLLLSLQRTSMVLKLVMKSNLIMA